MKDGDFAFSIDGENYCYGSVGEVVDALAVDCYEEAQTIGLEYYKAVVVKKQAGDFFDVDDLLDQIGDRASDECGEWADGFPHCTKEKRDELERLVVDWLNANVSVDFFLVGDAVTCTIGEEDL